MARKTLEQALMTLEAHAKKGESLSLRMILHLLASSGELLILIFLALPFCQPIQIPGFSTPFGIVIVLIGIQILRKKPFWLPNVFLKKEISAKNLKKIIYFGLKIIRKIRYLLRPRLTYLTRDPTTRIAHALVIILLGSLLAIPLPVPLANIPAAWSLLLLCIGWSAGDGLLILLSYIGTLITTTFFVFVFLSLHWAIHAVQ